jgi:hypothetical protein
MWFDVFLDLSLTVEGGSICFTDNLETMTASYLKIIEDIVLQSHNLPRPENQITKSDKQYLWCVLLEDEIVRDAVLEVEQIIQENLEMIRMGTDIYDKYVYLLTESKNTEKFVEENESREKFKEEVDRFIATSDEIRSDCPFVIRMNFARIHCKELNGILMKHCDDIIHMLTKAVSVKNIERENVMGKEFDAMNSKLGA